MNVNRVLKHNIKSSCVEYLANTTQRQLSSGVPPSKVFVDTSVGTLRDACTSWILSAWKWLQDHPKAVTDAWRQAAFKGWDLSYESLNSPRSRSTVYERFTDADDPSFALSVANPAPIVPGVDFDEDPDGPQDYDDDCAIDPSVLCDIRPGSLQVPNGISEVDGDLAYIGDEDLTDDEADGEMDMD